MEIWQEQSAKNNQTFSAIISVLVGLVLIIKLHTSLSALNTNAGSGLLLGILLFILGAYLLLMNSNQEITINPAERNILIKNTNRFYTKNKTIKFDEIADIAIGYLGKKSNFVENYYLVLKLKNGETCSLFGPGFYGINSRYLAEERRDRLWEYLKSNNN